MTGAEGYQVTGESAILLFVKETTITISRDRSEMARISPGAKPYPLIKNEMKKLLTYMICMFPGLKENYGIFYSQTHSSTATDLGTSEVSLSHATYRKG